MFICVIFPVADFRALHPETAGRLTRPHWGSADPRARFARGFGAIHMRNKSGEGFVGENYYADCDRMVRYPTQLFLRAAPDLPRPVLAYPLFRRFYFDGQSSGRFEFAFRLNELTVHDIRHAQPTLEYDIEQISSQTLKTTASVRLLDGRACDSPLYQAGPLLRDGYIMSSTETAKLATYDVDTVASKYVDVGPPFVFVRSSPDTTLKQTKRQRELLTREFKLSLTRSGVRGRDFDTVVLASPNGVGNETAPERLARLFYAQIRVLTFAHSFYLTQLEKGKLPAGTPLKPAVQGLLNRLKELAPDQGSVTDQQTLAAMSEILDNSDVSVSALTKEIESRLRSSWVRRWLSPIFAFFDKKADKAIEAAASAATEQLLSSGP